MQTGDHSVGFMVRLNWAFSDVSHTRNLEPGVAVGAGTGVSNRGSNLWVKPASYKTRCLKPPTLLLSASRDFSLCSSDSAQI
jgi:hypothetical protein